MKILMIPRRALRAVALSTFLIGVGLVALSFPDEASGVLNQMREMAGIALVSIIVGYLAWRWFVFPMAATVYAAVLTVFIAIVAPPARPSDSATRRVASFLISRTMRLSPMERAGVVLQIICTPGVCTYQSLASLATRLTLVAFN
jgi:hypothetical protein